MIGLVGGGPLWSAESNWFDRRVGEGVLRARLKARPLLAMEEHLVRIDPDAGRNLVVQLIDANPARSEARRILGSLTPPLRPSSNP